MTSAKKNKGIDSLLAFLEKKIPEGPWHYPEDQLADVSQKLLAAEVTREKIMHHIHEEIPYDLAVLPETWEPFKDGSVKIVQTIIVTHANHRAIILGKGGTKIRSISTESRLDLEKILGMKVHLMIHIRVDSLWQSKAHYYTETGLDG